MAGVFFAALPFRHSRLAGVFFAALPFRHFRLAGVFHRRAAIILASSRLAGVFHRRAAIILASFGLAGVFPSPRCHHLGILLVWPASFPRRAAIILASYRLAGVFPSPRCHFGNLVWPASSIAALPFSSSFGRRLPSPRCHLGILVWPASSIAAPPQTAPSIAAPPSLISAGSFNRRATFSHLGRLIHLPCHYLLSRPAHSFAAPPSLQLAGIFDCCVPISYLPAPSIAAPPFHGCATNRLSCNVTVLFWPVLLHDCHDQPLARHFRAPYEPDSHCSRHLFSSYLTLRGTPLKLVYFFGYPFSTRADSF